MSQLKIIKSAASSCKTNLSYDHKDKIHMKSYLLNKVVNAIYKDKDFCIHK